MLVSTCGLFLTLHGVIIPQATLAKELAGSVIIIACCSQPVNHAGKPITLMLDGVSLF